MQKITRQLYNKLHFLRREDIRYAIKVGVGAAMIAMLSFIPATQDLYAHWRLQWALVTYMFVCSMTIGAANTTTFQRLLGTCEGAAIAIVVWIVCLGNVVALALMSWLISVFCFWLIIEKKQGPMGRFILLTYNLSCLYSYSLSIKDKQGDEDEGGIDPAIFEIVLHRLIAITLGCIWGIFITRFIWPISARRKFKAGITLLWLRMGLAWKSGPLQVLLPGAAAPSHYGDIRREMVLRGFADSLEVIRQDAESEFELRGPFPSEAFRVILQCTSNMLDAFHALNVVIAKDAKVCLSPTMPVLAVKRTSTNTTQPPRQAPARPSSSATPPTSASNSQNASAISSQVSTSTSHTRVPIHTHPIYKPPTHNPTHTQSSPPPSNSNTPSTTPCRASSTRATASSPACMISARTSRRATSRPTRISSCCTPTPSSRARLRARLTRRGGRLRGCLGLLMRRCLSLLSFAMEGARCIVDID